MNSGERPRVDCYQRIQRQNCPLCQSTRQRPLRTVDRRQAMWHVVTCQACGFTYVADPRADTADHLDEPASDMPEVKPRHRQIARLLERLLADSTGRVVAEIGAGQGALGMELSGRFDYFGFEPAAGLSEGARSRGVRIQPAMFSSEQLPARADAVVLDNVLEHVLDPAGLFRQAAQALRSGGYLIVIVPNVHDLRQLHPVWRRRRHWVPPDHINYFRYRDVASLMTQSGFEVSGFGFRALAWPQDAKFAPRAVFESLGQHPFGLNLFGRLVRGSPSPRH